MQLFILGMHRSGTSAVTRLLNMMGAYFGPEGVSTGASDENPKGFWERRDVRNFCDAMLEAGGADWWRVADFAASDIPRDLAGPLLKDFRNTLFELDAHRPWVVKEPRLCVLFESVKPLLEAPVVVVTYRDPVEVAKSLEQRNGFPMHVGVALWEKYVTEAIAASRDVPRVVVRYDDVVARPTETVESLLADLQTLGVRGLRLPTDGEIAAFVSPELYRQRGGDGEGLLNARQLTLRDAFDRGEALETPVQPMSDGAICALRFFEQHRDREHLIEAMGDPRQLSAELRDVRLALDEQREEAHVSQQRLLETQEQLSQEMRRATTAEERLSEEQRRLSVAEESLTALAADLNEVTSQLERSRTSEHEVRGRLSDASLRLQRFEALVTRLEDRHRKLLTSRRWRIGSTLGDTMDRARGRPPQETMADVISALFEDFHALKESSRPAEVHAPPVKRRESVAQESVGKGNRAVPRRVPTSRRSVVVYTSIAHDYDDLKTPAVLPQGWDLVCFTDSWEKRYPAWFLRPFDYHHVDPTRRARYVKTHPHAYFQEYEWSVWVDANILITDDINDLVENVAANGDIGMFPHPHRKDIHAEADEIVRRGGLDDPTVISEQLGRYRAFGASMDGRLYETNVIIRRHNEKRVIDLMNHWWREIDNGSKRDQLSFPVVSERLNMNVVPLGRDGESVRTSTHFRRFAHGHDRREV